MIRSLRSKTSDKTCPPRDGFFYWRSIFCRIVGGFFAGNGGMEMGNMRVSLRKRKRCHRDTLREAIVCLTVESVPEEEKT